MNKLKQNYYMPTPKKWRQIGDGLLVAAPIISGYITTLPVSDDVKMWMIVGVNTITTLGKILTNLFTE